MANGIVRDLRTAVLRGVKSTRHRIAPLARRATPVLRHAQPVAHRYIAVNFFQSSVVLAAQAFMALFPLLICIIAIAPVSVGQTISNELRTQLGLTGASGVEVQTLVASRDELQDSLTGYGVVIVLLSATAFTRALQRIYQESWQLPKIGLRGSLYGLVWLVGLVGYLSLFSGGLELTSSHQPGVIILRILLLVAASFLLWWLTPYVLLGGRARLRSLLLTAGLSAVLTGITGVVSALVMPEIIGSNERQFGTIGVVFAIQSWLVVLAVIIVSATIIGAVLTQSDSLIGRWARGSLAQDAWRRTPRGKRRSSSPDRSAPAG